MNNTYKFDYVIPWIQKEIEGIENMICMKMKQSLIFTGNWLRLQQVPYAEIQTEMLNNAVL